MYFLVTMERTHSIASGWRVERYNRVIAGDPVSYLINERRGMLRDGSTITMLWAAEISEASYNEWGIYA